MTGRTLWAALSCTYACLYILEIGSVKLYDYPELILIFYRLVTFKNLLNTYSSQYCLHAAQTTDGNRRNTVA